MWWNIFLKPKWIKWSIVAWNSGWTAPEVYHMYLNTYSWKIKTNIPRLHTSPHPRHIFVFIWVVSSPRLMKEAKVINFLSYKLWHPDLIGCIYRIEGWDQICSNMKCFSSSMFNQQIFRLEEISGASSKQMHEFGLLEETQIFPTIFTCCSWF